MSRAVGVLVLIVLVAFGAIVGFYNVTPVEVDYLWGRTEWPLIAVILLAFASGLVIATGVALLRILALRVGLRRLQRQLQATETELRHLRNLPVTGAVPPSRARPDA